MYSRRTREYSRDSRSISIRIRLVSGFFRQCRARGNNTELGEGRHLPAETCTARIQSHIAAVSRSARTYRGWRCRSASQRVHHAERFTDLSSSHARYFYPYKHTIKCGFLSFLPLFGDWFCDIPFGEYALIFIIIIIFLNWIAMWKLFLGGNIISIITVPFRINY